LCCASDGGWPSEFAVQAGNPNHRELVCPERGVMAM